MDVLHTVKVERTYDEYKKFNDFVHAETTKLRLIRTVLVIGYILVSMLMHYLEMYKFLIFFVSFFAFYIAYLVYYKWARERSIKKCYESDEAGKNNVVVIDFYQDYFGVKDEYSQGAFPYDKLYKIYESDTNFYIMMSKMNGLGIVKANCSDELCEFIRGLKKD